jgi:hypothetical protein
MNVVGRGLPFTQTTEPMAPFEVGTNPVPVTSRVSALLPTGRPGGDTGPPPGVGLFTANVIGVEVDPSGFVTIT